MKKILDKAGKYLFKTFVLYFIIMLFYGSSLMIVALYLGDWDEAEYIFRNNTIFSKALIIIISGFMIMWFSVIVKYLFETFILEKFK